MGGIVFFKTKMLERIKDFYINRIGMDVWLEQVDCVILKFENLLLGFYQSEEVENQGIITFYYENTDRVYEMYKKFRLEAENEPSVDEKHKIYHFSIKDPEGRRVEFQYFIR